MDEYIGSIEGITEDELLTPNDRAVRALAGGNAALEEALWLHAEYTGVTPDALPEPDANGRWWFSVGHNASHFFSVGVGADGQRYRASDGPKYVGADAFAALDVGAQRAALQCLDVVETFPYYLNDGTTQMARHVEAARWGGDDARAIALVIAYTRALECCVVYDERHERTVAAWNGYLGHR